ncbi:phosphonate metabolism transcriptional regulator PhnF [Roseomonas sp. OT10]|uniref:phosphonate metabolism transcriptional regulator PhnF n=1 Tax=Roseomonas cutis TaxID=2897332 RepID=UPI001E3E96F1|nr:phosphonate metabolism transcriptional regulator PhnF [Roseomonas sp. OT10]UFN48801.1 phosphonate metabolism transcriptional regulator PhnF [Roseomonas sp. OT10]
MTSDPPDKALWHRIRSALLAEIRDGRLAPGARLPTETALMSRFGVGRHSVRRALEALETQGLVSIRHGSGSYVRPAGVLDYRLSERTRFSQNLLEQGREPSGTLLSGIDIPAPPGVALALRLPEGEPVHCLRRLGLADGAPVNLSTACYPARRFPGLLEAFRDGDGISRVLAAYGVADYLRLTSTITTRLPSAGEARHLDQAATDPVLVVCKVDADLSGVPIAWSETVWAGARVQLSIDNSALLGRDGDAADVAG